MELLYLLVVFLVIVGLLALRRPLYQAMLGGLLATGILYRLSPLAMLEATGRVFTQVLEDAGVFKRTEQGQKAFLAFVEEVNRT